MEVIGGIFALLSIVLFAASFVGLFRPDWFKQTKRWKAFTKLMVASFLTVIIGGALLPEPDASQEEAAPDAPVAADAVESAGSELAATETDVSPKKQIAEDPSKPEEGEKGLRRGFMQVRVLEDDHIYGLKVEAMAAGRDVTSMYPAHGPIAIVVLPVRGLNFDKMATLLPLVCEVTVEKEPDLWKTYSEVHFLNRSLYTGMSFADFFDSCARREEPNEWGWSLGDVTPLAGRWQGEIPWKLAGLDGQESVGYGEYRGL